MCFIIKLYFSYTNNYNILVKSSSCIRCTFMTGTLDEHAGQFQKGCDKFTQSEQLMTEGGVSDDGICTCTLPSPGFSQILNKILRDGIGVSIFL